MGLKRIRDVEDRLESGASLWLSPASTQWGLTASQLVACGEGLGFPRQEDFSFTWAAVVDCSLNHRSSLWNGVDRCECRVFWDTRGHCCVPSWLRLCVSIWSNTCSPNNYHFNHVQCSIDFYCTGHFLNSWGTMNIHTQNISPAELQFHWLKWNIYMYHKLL